MNHDDTSKTCVLYEYRVTDVIIVVCGYPDPRAKMAYTNNLNYNKTLLLSQFG